MRRKVKSLVYRTSPSGSVPPFNRVEMLMECGHVLDIHRKAEPKDTPATYIRQHCIAEAKLTR